MDNFAYLNEIAASNRPAPKKKCARFDAKTALTMKIAVGGVVLFCLLMAFGAILSGLGGKTEGLMLQLYTRTTNLNTAITSYNQKLRSSDLRSLAASLSGVLSSTSTQLMEVIGGGGEVALDAKTAEEEETVLMELQTSLANAQLNGILDRAYANLVGLQVSLLLSMISGIEARTDDAELLEVLSTYRGNLEVLHQGFEAYDDPGA